MTEVSDITAAVEVWPSIDNAQPVEEGGPIARAGFNYQDEIAVGFLIDMLASPALVKVHLETHDDIVLIWEEIGARTAEYIQVKASEEEKFWSVPDICQRKKAKTGTSIFEKSLDRDGYLEDSLFRLVTLRPVVAALKPLTFPRSSPGRQSVDALAVEIESRCSGFRSPKGRDAAFWVANCLWDHRDSERAVEKDNLVRLMRLAHQEGTSILFEPAENLLLELRARAKAAGAARWLPDPSRKVITREELRTWWEERLLDISQGALTRSGGKLAVKMAEAGLPGEMTALAAALRRGYASEARAPRYLDESDVDNLQGRVLSEVASLRARFVAGELDIDSVQFHSLCLSRMDALNAERGAMMEDRSAFLKGCLYDITDRCLLRFNRPAL
ncbi:dsDNA nuclease domain-containing protein [Rhizobium leguminosarum]|uniref:dsDNA nuclease domain-containing protein n=1 Tax=Rhizobium leguminosarum TaxID=384 RepID=UPI001C94D82A|nr:dsDNA nuclease domain-containing protein [Rhizobium leguminosarum]MBY5625025.1 DUF4297 domain-containing protein [Rhizobium leguminosarum]MBY5707067.1 DUF4297 domain-containing protein [Rhizobium leguminosarum]